MNEPGSQLLEVPAGSLKPGMYVAELDKPWLDTPFMVQGFYIRHQKDVDAVAEHCSFVFVDPRRREGSGPGLIHPPPAAAAKSRWTKAPQTSLKQEFSTVKVELESAGEAMRKVFAQLRTGRHLDVRAVQRIIDPMVDSVLRNQDAAAALMRLKAKGDYLFNHSIANAVWAAVLGRQLALQVSQLRRLALGAALSDVGMTRLPDSLTETSRPLSDEEFARVRGHVEVGVEMLTAGGGVDEQVVEVVANHHERFDGSGYPQGKIAAAIPLLARIVGLVDSYDAMITDRPYAQARSSFEAVQELNDLGNTLFQQELVEQFVMAIGLFPTGSVVELSSGEVGVVVAQNPTRRLRPKVVVILDPQKVRYPKLVVVDLSKYLDTRPGDDLWISAELEPGAHGIEPDEYFL